MCVRRSAQRSCMADVKALIHDDPYSPTSSSPISACSYLKGERQTDRVKHPTSSYFYHHLNLHKRKSRLKGGKELILRSCGGLGEFRFDLWSGLSPYVILNHKALGPKPTMEPVFLLRTSLAKAMVSSECMEWPRGLAMV